MLNAKFFITLDENALGLQNKGRKAQKGKEKTQRSSATLVLNKKPQ